MRAENENESEGAFPLSHQLTKNVTLNILSHKTLTCFYGALPCPLSPLRCGFVARATRATRRSSGRDSKI